MPGSPKKRARREVEKSAESGASPDARARRSDDLIPQQHGGALRPAWQPGHVQRTSWSEARRRVAVLAQEATEDAMRQLIALTTDPDSRVAVVAITQLLDRTLGRPGDAPQFGATAEVGARLALERLTADQLRALLDAVRAGAIKPAEGEDGQVIEGEAV